MTSYGKLKTFAHLGTYVTVEPLTNTTSYKSEKQGIFQPKTANFLRFLFNYNSKAFLSNITHACTFYSGNLKFMIAINLKLKY